MLLELFICEPCDIFFCALHMGGSFGVQVVILSLLHGVHGKSSIRWVTIFYFVYCTIGNLFSIYRWLIFVLVYCT